MVELSGRIAWVGSKVMDEFEEQYQEANQNENWESAAPISADRWLVIAVVALLVVSGIALAYGYRQHAIVNQLAAQAGTTTQAMNQLQAQVSTLTDRLNEMTAKQSAATSQPAAALVRRADLRRGSCEHHGSPGSHAIAGARRQACSGEARYDQASHTRR